MEDQRHNESLWLKIFFQNFQNNQISTNRFNKGKPAFTETCTRTRTHTHKEKKEILLSTASINDQHTHQIPIH
jgi:hypothetical protein